MLGVRMTVVGGTNVGKIGSHTKTLQTRFLLYNLKFLHIHKPLGTKF